MSATVDSRVVEMHFDNSDFMNKISETISALERLNDEINLFNTSKGLGDFGAAQGSNELNSVANSVDGIASRFTTLGIVGQTVIQRLTNAGINMGLKVAGGLTAAFSQIKQGGFVRAENIEQAKFLLEGLGANVEEVFEHIDSAVTGTSYGLDEAARAAASFYASGITNGNKLEDSMRAVAGVAAMTGSDYASIADIFTTVAGQGKVMTMQLRMMEGRGLNAAATMRDYFNEVLTHSDKFSDSVVKNVKDITGGTKVSEEAVRDFVSKGKIDFEAFSGAMDYAFGEHAQEANKTFSGSLANMKTALSRLGEMFITPAMKAAIPLFNSLRTGISSFATTLKDSELITSYWSKDLMSLSNSISLVIYKLRDSGVIREVAISVINVYLILSNILHNVADAFREVFNLRDSYGFLDAAESLEVFNHKLKEVIDKTKDMEGFKNVMVGIFSAFKFAGNIVSGVLKVFGSFISAIFGISSATGGLSKTFADLMNKIAEASESTSAFDLIAKAFNEVGKVVQKGVSYISSGIVKVLSLFNDVVLGARDFSEALAVVGGAFTSLFVYVKWGRLIEGLKGDFKALFHLMDDTGSILAMPSRISKTLGSLQDTLKSMQHEISSKILRNLATSVLMLAVALKLISTVDSDKVAQSLASVTILLMEMELALQSIAKMAKGDIVSSVKGLLALGSLANALIKVGIALLLMAAAVKMLSSLDPEELATGLIGVTVILGALLGFVIAIDRFSGAEKSLGKIGFMLIEIGLALNLMASAIEKISSLDPIQLAKGLGTIIVLMGAIFGLSAGMSKFGSGGGAGMVAAGAGMVLMAAAINILTPALKKLGDMKLTELAKGLGAVAAALIVMAAASNFVSLGGSTGFTIMAIGIASLATSIQRLSEIDPKTLAISIGALAAAMGVMLVAGAVAGTVAPGLLALGAAMLLMSASVAVLGAGLVLVGVGLTSVASGIITFVSVGQTAILMFQNIIITVLKSLISLFPMIAEQMAVAFVSFIETIAELAPRLKDALTKIITIAIEAFMENVPRLIVLGISFIIWFMKGLEKAIPRIAKSAALIIAGFIEGIAEGMDKIVEAGIDLMLAFINGLADGIRKHKEDVRNAILNLCEALLEAFMSFFGIASPSKVMANQGKNLMAGLAKGIKSAAGRVKNALINAVKSAFNAIKKWVKNFVSTGETIVSNIIKGIKTKISNIANTIKTGLTKAVHAVKSAASKFVSAGADLVAGIARGIKNGLSSVISAVGSIASSAISHFKKKLGINSPSKEFAKLGAGIPEGTVKGINKASHFVNKAVDKMGGSAIAKMRNVLSDIGDSVRFDSDFNPTITPILDLSSVEKESNRINGLLAPDTIEAGYSTANVASNQNMMMFAMNELINAINGQSANNNPTVVNVTNNVDGSDNPEAFASRFVNQLKMQMRTY